jgi:hypothetical protein
VAVRYVILIYPAFFGVEYIESASKPVRAEPSQLINFRLMKDTAVIPLGDFCGQTIVEVSARFLCRLRDANWLSKYPTVADSFARNAKAINK